MNQGLCYAYNKYCDYYKTTSEIPFYKSEPKPKRIPLNEKIEILIGYATRKIACKLLLSKETGLRLIEPLYLKVKDIDLEKRLVYSITAKHGAPRTLRARNLHPKFSQFTIRIRNLGAEALLLLLLNKTFNG